MKTLPAVDVVILPAALAGFESFRTRRIGVPAEWFCESYSDDSCSHLSNRRCHRGPLSKITCSIGVGARRFGGGTGYSRIYPDGVCPVHGGV